jgi:Mitochondrial carrier protein
LTSYNLSADCQINSEDTAGQFLIIITILQAAACGASAAFGHDLCMTPFDTVKQRMQLGEPKNYEHSALIRTTCIPVEVVSFVLEKFN